jgi:hypothetical protein
MIAQVRNTARVTRTNHNFRGRAYEIGRAKIALAPSIRSRLLNSDRATDL